jgi:hypothetical protein
LSRGEKLSTVPISVSDLTADFSREKKPPKIGPNNAQNTLLQKITAFEKTIQR